MMPRHIRDEVELSIGVMCRWNGFLKHRKRALLQKRTAGSQGCGESFNIQERQVLGSTLLRGVSDKGSIELLHSLALTHGAQDSSRFMFLQGQDNQRFLPTVEAFVIVHRHVTPQERPSHALIEHQHRTGRLVQDGVGNAAENQARYTLPAARAHEDQIGL